MYNIFEISLKSGNEFEDWVAKIVRGKPGNLNGYQTLAKGRHGDGGLDIIDTRHKLYFACYGAETKDTFTKNVSRKFKGDFQNFLKNNKLWASEKFIFIFVTNQIKSQQYADVISEIIKISNSYNHKIEIWSLSQFFEFYNLNNNRLRERFQNEIHDKIEKSLLHHMLHEQDWNGSFSEEYFNSVYDLFYYLEKNKQFDSNINNLYLDLSEILKSFSNYSKFENGHYKSWPRDEFNTILKETRDAIYNIHDKLTIFTKSLSNFIRE